ncbi:TonB-dependent receptor plug domain-containing protein [Paraglaciecola aquimarina]|uniref:TonB-dependent receptor plug domain-containing protein n=1 Tax=Paraglaciecola algarum TaxID=3050085 RepID=A0ABS9D7T7_9ALTE|nr:TonB-dependent receptor plug domain-containing protein [Paraglaciecola sp. G1-23]MCF2947874.1 TonB-dependent receptor plug domain-containing protein [Paraglaciecola sp. G1-23]
MKNSKWVSVILSVGALDAVAQVAPQDTGKISATVEVEKIEVISTRPQGIHISSDQITTMPGGFGDPLKALDALPGVVLALPSSGGPIAQPAIRGSSPGDNQYESDFLPVGYVFHREGLSVFNPELIETFDLYTSSWSGQYNDSIGGVIKTQLRDPSFEQTNLILDLSQIRSGLLIESPISENIAFYASYRESLVHHFIDDITEDEDFVFSTPPRNHDYQAKLVWDINSNNTLRLVATGAEDIARIEFKPGSREVQRNPDLASGEGFTSKYDNVGVLLENQSGLGDTILALNILDTEVDIGEGIVEQSVSQNTESLFKWKTVTDLSFGQLGLGELSWGGHYRQQSLKHTNRSRLVTCVAEFSTCQSSALFPIVEDKVDLDVTSMAVFSDWAVPLSKHWDATFTLAVSRDDFTDQTQIEPRVAASYQLAADQRLRLSAGQYHQWFRDTDLLSPVFGNPELSLSEATMAGIAYEQSLQGGWDWKLDLYYKTLKNLPIPLSLQTQNPEDVGFSDKGEGEAVGAELFINKSLVDNWYGWFSLAYTKSERKNGANDQVINYEFDIPVIANLVAKYQWNDNWHFGIKWTYRSGRRYTDIIGATPVYSDADDPANVSDEPIFYQPTYGEFNALRRSAGHRIDVRVDYYTNVFGVPVNAYLDILNLLGNERLQEEEWNADYSDFIPDYEFPDEMFPGLGVSIRF